ncbi:MAG TPA: tetratricopeptide repeat protein [Desulfuromonadales bacterium]|nr:tetratricopeptide repeat protein [Desulfuromonadales bacterium]
MFNILISLGLFTVVAVVLKAVFALNVWLSSLIAVAVFALVYVLLTRIVMKKVGALMETAQRDIQAGRTEKAIATLKSGFKYGNWQLYVKPQLNAQIGTILYLKRDFSEAFDYLKKGFVRHWVAMGMLAVCYMKRNKTDKMIETFEKAVSASKKEALIWNIYAFCLEKVGNHEKAISVMEKGLKKAGNDERLQGNLEALREGKKMKMMAYGDIWYQFHLEKTGAIVKQQTKAVQGRRRIVRR